MTNFNKATTGGSFAVKEQVETSPTKHKHSCEQQEQIVEDNEGFSTTGPTNSSSRSESTTNANLETAQSVDQMTQSPHISDRKAPNIITFEDLIAGKTKFKTWSNDARDEETLCLNTQQSVTQELKEPVKEQQPQSVSNIRKIWESGNLSDDQQQKEEESNEELEQQQSPQQEDDFRSIMNRFKHLEMSKADNLIFDEDDENKACNNQVTLVAGKASMFEKLSQNQNNNNNRKHSKQQKIKQKQEQIQRCCSDPDSVRGRAALFEAQLEK
eukprot:TRINITY_DN2638_c0_g1_i3.p1 TRINITY_DN2638_c0_g1~~TRINITY_DN2638_c0_g1_i3.p1  ORF type:complete len:270 (+),score=48.14 TRINITY_DN2638_c0_g1_i3:135-944(+)